MSKWQIIKDYINSQPVGTIISRKNIINLTNDNIYLTCTPGRYLNYLTNIEILEKITFFTYKVISHINYDLTFKEFINASKGGWQRWFIIVKP